MAQLTFKRYEVKYLLDAAQRARLAQLMEGYMVPDEWGASTVRNIYLDTPSHLLIRRSLEHPLYKEKVLLRSYREAGVEDEVFLELKKKFDGVVYKRRCTLTLGDALALVEGRRVPEGQIERELAYSCARYEGLAPAMSIFYDREAFYGRDDHDFRMTFDASVRCRWDDVSLHDGDRSADSLLLPDGEALLEVKCGAAFPLWLVRFLSAERIRKVSFSKYGAAYLLEEGLVAASFAGPAPVASTAARPLSWPARKQESLPVPSVA